MKTLEEIKDVVAKWNGYDSWYDFFNLCLNGFKVDEAIDQVAKLYAEQAIDLASERVSSERAEAYVYSTPETNGVILCNVYKESITNIKKELK